MVNFGFKEDLNNSSFFNLLDGEINFKNSLDGKILSVQPLSLNLNKSLSTIQNQPSVPTQSQQNQDINVESLVPPFSDTNNTEWHSHHHSGSGEQDHPDDIDNAPTSFGTLQTLADYLRVGYWSDNGRISRYYNISDTGTAANSGVLYYNVSGYSSDSDGISAVRQDLVREAFNIFEEVLGIDFVETTSTDNSLVDFFFQDNGSGAYNSSAVYSNGVVAYSIINVTPGWYGGYSDIGGINSYTFQTFIHEIGHALGLGHQANYNGSATYSTDALWINDSWQQSMMSYFSQSENTGINASYAQLVSPMAVDWLALDQIYSGQSFGSTTFGVSQAFAGDTIWGVGTNISATTSVAYNGLAGFANTNAFNIVDGSGTDTINFSNYSANQLIDLSIASASSTTGTISNVGGLTGNMTIAVGTVIENATSGSGDDTLIGNDVDNDLQGGSGNDSIVGNNSSSGGGFDTLVGGAGNDILDSDIGSVDDTQGDSLDGGSGDDTLIGENGDDTLLGGTGNDSLIGDDNSSGANNDSLLGGAGDDTLVGEDGNDLLQGDSDNGENGSDSLNGGAGNDSLYGNGGVDRLFGGTGNDYLDSDTLGQSDTTGDLLDGGDGNDILQGEAGNDTLIGGIGDDMLDGNDGSSGGTDIDSLDGGAGNDTLVGEDGNDILQGDSTDAQNGNDSLSGGSGDDELYGKGGADSLVGGTGNDNINGGSGNDNLIWFDGDGNDTIDGGTGDDLVQVFTDTLNGGNFELSPDVNSGELEQLNLGSFTLDISNIEYIDLNGGAGDDTLIAQNLSGTSISSVIFTAGSGDDTLNAIAANIDVLAFGGIGNDSLRGSNSAGTTDNINGNSGDDVLYSSDGDDSLNGGNDNDSLFASNGEDTLIGGSGQDFLHGGSGNDYMEGNQGNDTYRVNQLGDVVIEALNEGTDRVESSISFSLSSNVENLKLIGILNRNGFGNSLANNIVGNSGNNYFIGKVGNDTINGLGGNDYAFGNDGDDSLIGSDGNDILNGNAGNDTIYGNNDDDRLNGQNGDDSLLGGNGNDIIIGGDGSDVLTGGAGNDTFRYDNRNHGVDTITDYNVTDDRFVIRRTGFSNSLSFGVLNANQFTLGASASDANDRFIYNNATGALYFDRDGNGGLAQQQIATLSVGLALDNTEFVVV